ncbi:PRMT10 [Scenedesmus sp. PABB004]|nr:PRMT10 [Scenedesmus sp. PABB004]
MAEGRGALSKLDGRAPDGKDFANYFCTYAFLYHQKDMLEDHKRTGAYYNAVIQNKRLFADRVVLDVGTGSGILAIFAAMAGARKVYAVEATSMAKHARTLVEANKLGHVVEVIQGTIETIDLPEKVDVIISEWMGYFLLRESMLDSVLVARDKWLKPGGALYPSHARMFIAPMRTNAAAQRVNDFQNSMYGWSEFLKEMNAFYNVDLDCLSEAFRGEQAEYYLNTSAWGNVHPSQLLGPGVPFKAYDLLKVTVDELKADLRAEVTLPIVDGGPVDAFCGWFDVTFAGSPEAPADDEVKLPTGPDATGATHWGQQVFMMSPSLDCAPGDSLACSLKLSRQAVNHRLLELEMAVRVTGKSAHAQAEGGAARTLKWHID